MTGPQHGGAEQFNYQPPADASKHDAATLEALHAAIHIEVSGPAPKIGPGQGPYQAIKDDLPAISDQGAAALAHMVNAETGKTEFRQGEQLPMPSDSLSKLNSAELRSGLHLPLDASDQKVDDVMSANNDRELRKSLHLPADASSSDVDNKMASDNASALRQSLHLPANASDADVDSKMASNNELALRQSLKLPADASNADVDRAYNAMLDAAINNDAAKKN